MGKLVAALFVAENGPYLNLSYVDAWTLKRDARKYEGSLPVVAHPPCERWGSYWFGGPSAKIRRKLGDDGGCFVAALNSVRKYGGVIEHPSRSHAWNYFDLTKPLKEGGWIKADPLGGWTCQVDQGHYGHKARKPTWLYAVGCRLPNLIWGPSINKMVIEESFPSNEHRRLARSRGIKPAKRISVRERTNTPIEFRDLLIQMALTAK